MSNKIIASYYIDTGTNCTPHRYDVRNVMRASVRCGVDLTRLEEVLSKLPYGAEIAIKWNPEDEGDAETLTYIFELANG